MPVERFTVPENIAVRVDQAAMRSTVENIFEGVGMPRTDAEQAADTLLYADLRGIDSHGVSNMFPIYMHWFREGHLNPTAKPKVIREAPAVATIDDGAGLGLATGPRAMDLAIEKAEACGIGAVSVTNGRHYGAASYHAHRAIPHGMIGLSMTIGGLQVLPTFGSKPMVGLNPIAVAVGAGDEPPFIFDASMSSVAGNKIRIAQRLGATVLPGWIAAADGTPILEESEIPKEYHMLPSGGTRDGGSHKGYGLAVMVDVLCGVLAGDPPGFLRPPGVVGHHFAAYKIDAFCDPDEFADHMRQFVAGLRDTPPAPGHDRVLYAGLEEHETEVARRIDGIPFHPDVVQFFRDTADEIGVDHALGS
jgi:L-2-hydroxycarboxylate dehydrogenase (NAD+)